jgi:malate permease and related proteins
MENILLIFTCIGIGLALKRLPSLPANAYVALNHFVIYISLPALALYYIPKIELSSQLLYPVGVAWLGFGLSFTFFTLVGRYFKWSKKLTGSLILTAGLGNTAFLGYPITEALYGGEGLQLAILVDQPGSSIVIATLGILVATSHSRGTTSGRQMLRKVLSCPPFIAFVIALTLNLTGTDFPELTQAVFSKLGSTVTPVALTSVGLQLTWERQSKHWNFLALGLGFKLFMYPLFFLILYKFIFDADILIVNVSVMQAAMAPMITASILASSYGLKPKLSTMMVGIGIPLSFLTLSLWYWILSLVN